MYAGITASENNSTMELTSRGIASQHGKQLRQHRRPAKCPRHYPHVDLAAPVLVQRSKYDALHHFRCSNVCQAFVGHHFPRHTVDNLPGDAINLLPADACHLNHMLRDDIENFAVLIFQPYVPGLQGARIADVRITDASIKKTKITGARITDARITDAILTDARSTNTTFTGCWHYTSENYRCEDYMCKNYKMQALHERELLKQV
jgi:hypothetical protein